jgi:hypothetical protein
MALMRLAFPRLKIETWGTHFRADWRIEDEGTSACLLDARVGGRIQ